MKHILLLSGCSLLGITSCALSTDKPKEEESGSSAIPPPTQQQVASTSANEVQEELPELSSSSEQADKPTKKVNVKEIDGFRFKNVLDDLPSQRDLASPPASISPSSQKTEGSQVLEEETKPLVVNP